MRVRGLGTALKLMFPLLCFKNEIELPFDESDELFVVEGLSFEASSVSTNHPARFYESFASTHRGAAAVKHFRQHIRSPRVPVFAMAKLMAKYPWLDAHDLQRHRRLAQGHRAPPAALASDGVLPDGCNADDDCGEGFAQASAHGDDDLMQDLPRVDNGDRV